MAVFKGTTGSDNLAGTIHQDDIFRLYQGGDDTADGRGGNDTFLMRDTLNANDTMIGGDGADTVTLSGIYANLTFGANTLSSIEKITLKGNGVFNLIMDDGNVAAGQSLSVIAGRLTSVFTFDGSAETDGSYFVRGSQGADQVTGGGGNDVFAMRKGGDDTVAGGDGDDLFRFGAGFNPSDTVNGGVGYDTVELAGDNYYDVTFDGGDLADIEEIDMVDAHSYFLKFEDNVLQSGEHMTLDASAASGATAFWGGSESDGGSFTVITGTGFQNTLYGGAGDDVLDFRHGQNGGLFTASGNDGNDTIYVGSNYSASNVSFNGNAGSDTFVLDGSYNSLNLAGGSPGLRSFETVKFTAGHNYGQFFTAMTVTNDVSSTSTTGSSSGLTVTYDASELGFGDLLNLNLSASTAAAQIIMGGGGSDQITGNGNNDTFIGGLGRDSMYGGAGNDVYVVNDVSESTGLLYDAPVGINWDTDKIDLDGAAPTALDTAVNGGTLNQDGNFNSTLETLVGASQLAAGHAVIFTANGGDYNNLPLLIVDANGTAGYQGGQDYIFYIFNYTGTLDVGDFI